MGGRPAGVLADRRGGAALHRAAAAGRPARPDGRRGARAGDRRRARRRGCSRRPASKATCSRCRTRACSTPRPRPRRSSPPTDPALIVFTSGTSGEPKPIRHGRATSSARPCRPSTGSAPRPGELAWCTAASGWSKSARNSFIAPWLRGAAALLHDARFDPAERLDVVEREGVAVLCMAPTEYRAIAKRVEPARAPRAAPRRRRRRAAQPRGRARLAGGRRAWPCTTATGRPRPGR